MMNEAESTKLLEDLTKQLDQERALRQTAEFYGEKHWNEVAGKNLLARTKAAEAEIAKLKADNAVLSKKYLEAEEEAERLWKEIKRLNAIWKPNLEDYL